MPDASAETFALEAVLFDLDGTLLDTAPDLAGALNRVLVGHGRPALPFSRIRPWVSHGSFALTRLGFDYAETSAEFEAARLALLDHYHAHLADETTPFAGVQALIARLEASGLRWGIVTNKPDWLTQPLLRALALPWLPGCVVSGDTLPERKPHPAPLLYAATRLGCTPAACAYVGDAERDIEAGRRAGMRTLAASWGYYTEAEDPAAWAADAVVHSPEEVWTWVAARRLVT